jgi:hypothetical protein
MSTETEVVPDATSKMIWPKYTLVTHVGQANANDMTPGDEFEQVGALGIVIAQHNPPTGEVTVKRIGKHLEVGTQNWDAADTVPVTNPPQITTDYGTFALGARVVFDGKYEGLRGTLIGKSNDGYATFLLDEDQRDTVFSEVTSPHWFDPDSKHAEEMFSPATSGYKLREQVGIDKHDQPLRVGDRVVYLGAESSEWHGTLGTVDGKGPAGKLVALRIDAKKQDGSAHPMFAEYSDTPANLNPDWMVLLEPEPTVAKQPTGWTSKDGKPIYVGDLLVYVGPTDWAGVQVRALNPAWGGKKFELVKLNEFLSTTDYNDYNVGQGVNLTASDLRHVEQDPSNENQLGDLTYLDTNVPICVGDDVMFVSHVVPSFIGIRAKVTGWDDGSSLKVIREDGVVVEWGASYVAKVGAGVESDDPDAPNFAYTDGVPLRFGDRVVYDPGHSKAGRTGTIVGAKTGNDGSKYATVRDDDLSDDGITTTTWLLGNFSRLQDEDKEKVADEAPKAQAALERVRELFGRLSEARDDLETQVSAIEDELTSAEQREVEVEFDSDNVSASVSVSTSRESLLGWFSVSDGEVEVEDSAIDSYVEEIAEVHWDAATATASLDGYLGDLHTAFGTGQKTLAEFTAMLDEVESIVNEVLSTEGIEDVAKTKIVSPEAETFEGVIHNARFGVVLPEDKDTGPALRFDVVGDHVEHTGGDASNTKATRRVRLVGRQVGHVMSTVGVSDVKHLEGRRAIVTEDSFGGWFPTAVAEVPGVAVDAGALDYSGDEEEAPDGDY